MEPAISPRRSGDAPVILIVDDEPSVLSSLRRLFRGKRYEVLTESNPALALKRLDNEHIDLIISDMRMPEINGTEILRHAADRQPASVRILLTGYADLEDAIEAVNSGGIFRYLTKPWNNQDIVEAVEAGLYVKELEGRNEQLASELSKQNAALKDLTATLAGRVRKRNRDFESNLKTLKTMSEDIGSDMDVLVNLLVGIIESRLDEPHGQTLRVSSYARALAAAASCKEELVGQIGEAALFHELGKMALDPELLNKKEAQLTKKDLKAYHTNALLADSILGQTTRYQEASKIIRHLYEHFDGCGVPDQLSRIGIPLGSRILAVATAYEKLRNGQILESALSSEDALDWIKKRAGRNFDPDIVEHLETLVAEFENQRDGSISEGSRLVGLEKLEQDMVLATDLISAENVPLGLAGDIISAEVLARLQEYQSLTRPGLQACVRNA